MQSPIITLMNKCQLTDSEFVGTFLAPMTREKFGILRDGGFDELPPALIRAAEAADEEDGGGERLKADYAAFKASLSSEEREALEKRRYPEGRIWGKM